MSWTLILSIIFMAKVVDSGFYRYPYHQIVETVPQTEVVESSEVPEKSISYAISANDYNYLKEYKKGHQDVHYNSNIVGTQTAAIASTSQLHSENHHGFYNNIVQNDVNDIITTQANLAQHIQSSVARFFW
nr:uncharacterized protein LOC128682780 isoform X2 [Plodia interpunctella]